MVNILGIRNDVISMTDVQIGDESLQAVMGVLKSGQLAQGPKVEEFEKAFADYTGTNYAIAVNSGTATLHVALLAAGIVGGDEVITPPFSFIATANCCLFCGAVPVFVDIDKVTEGYKLSRDELQQKLKAKGIQSAVHYPIPIPKQPLYRSLGYDDSLPASETVDRRVLSLPVHPGVVDAELEKIVEALQ